MLKPHSDIKQQLDMIPRTLSAGGALETPVSLRLSSLMLSRSFSASASGRSEEC